MRRGWAVLLAVMSLVVLAPTSGVASPPEYQMIDLGSIGQGPYYMSQAVGMSNGGLVVGHSAESIASEVHLVRWDRDHTLADLGTAPHPGYLQAMATNGRSDIVGTIVEECEQPGPGIPGFGCPAIGFLYRDGEWTLIRGEGAIASKAVDVNASGQVLGTEYHPDDGLRTFIWDGGRFTYLDGLALEWPTAINDRGQVVGWYEDETGEYRSILWERGVVVEIITSGEYGENVWDVNNRGQVVGSYLGSGTRRAFLWEDGVATDLPLPADAWWSDAAAISERGQVVGAVYLLPMSPISSAVIWDVHGELTMLGSGQGCGASDINARGQVVGSCLLDYGPRAFLWEK